MQYDQQQGGLPDMQVNQPYQPYPIPHGTTPPTPGVIPKAPKKRRPVVLIVLLVLFILLFMAALGFGIWAFTTRQDYKNNSDQKSARAAEIAIQQESTRKDKEFVEKEKSPLKVYDGPEAYGSLHIEYPKTWAAYVVEKDKSSIPVEGYFHPGFVPAVDSGTAFALRFEVSNLSYAQEMKKFEGKIKGAKVTVSPIVLEKVSGITGARLQGEINTGQQGVMVLLPLRDKTIKISTDSKQFLGDFDNIILKAFSFVP